MAVIFSKSSGQNNGLWKDIETVLMAVIKDVDKHKIRDDELVKQLFSVKKSKKFGEKTSGLTEFSNFEKVGEGNSAVLDDIQEGWPKLIIHSAFNKKFVTTKEMADDNNLDDMKLAASNFAKSYKRSRAQFATAALTDPGAQFVFGSHTFDKTTGDGEALFSTAHKGKKDGVAAQSNVYTNAFGADSEILYRLANVGRNFVNDSGNQMGYEFDTIVVPGNTPRLEDMVKRIIRSDLIVGSSDNDVNTQKGLWKMIVLPYWVVPAGKEPYIIMSSEMNEELLGNVFYDRTPLDVMNEINIDTRNLEWTGYCRWSAGFNNWRQVIMGGADAGTTLAA